MVVDGKSLSHYVLVTRMRDRWSFSVRSSQERDAALLCYLVSTRSSDILMLMRVWADMASALTMRAYDSVLNGQDPDRH